MCLVRMPAVKMEIDSDEGERNTAPCTHAGLPVGRTPARGILVRQLAPLCAKQMENLAGLLAWFGGASHREASRLFGGA